MNHYDLIKHTTPDGQSFVSQGHLNQHLIDSPIGSDRMRRQSTRSPVHLHFVGGDYEGAERNAVPVTQNSILGISAYWRAANILCGLMGRIPLQLKRKGKKNSTTTEHNDERNFLVSKKPHSHLKSRTWRKTMQLHKMLTAGGFSEIIRDPDTNEPINIVPLDPNRVTWGVMYDQRTNLPIRQVYIYNDVTMDVLTGRFISSPRNIEFNDMIQIKGLSYDAVMGIEMKEVLQRDLGLILARTEYSRKYYIGNARIRGFLMVPPGNHEEYGQMMDIINDEMDTQADNPLKTVPLFDGVEFQKAENTPEDSQLTDAIKMTPDTVSQITGVPSFLIGGEKRDSYNALEKMIQGFFNFTLADEYDDLEKELDDKLLTDKEQRSDELCFKFDQSYLMQTDLKSWYKILKDNLHGGLWSWEEVREAMDRTTDQSDQTFLFPQNILGADPTSLNQLEAGSSTNQTVPVPANETEQTNMTTVGRVAVRNLCEHSAQRMCKRFSDSANRAAKKGAEHLESFLSNLSDKESKLESETMRYVYDVAISGGLIDSLPDYAITKQFEMHIKHALKNVPDNVPSAVADACNEATTAVLDDLPDICTGVENGNEN